MDAAPKVKWLNVVGSQVLSLAHAAGGCERNWRTHTVISSDLRQSMRTSALERYVKLHKNMRLRDRATTHQPRLEGQEGEGGGA